MILLKYKFNDIVSLCKWLIIKGRILHSLIQNIYTCNSEHEAKSNNIVQYKQKSTFLLLEDSIVIKLQIVVPSIVEHYEDAKAVCTYFNMR